MSTSLKSQLAVVAVIAVVVVLHAELRECSCLRIARRLRKTGRYVLIQDGTYVQRCPTTILLDRLVVLNNEGTSHYCIDTRQVRLLTLWTYYYHFFYYCRLLVGRRWRSTRQLGGSTDWEYEIGDPTRVRGNSKSKDPRIHGLLTRRTPPFLLLLEYAGRRLSLSST